MNWRFEILLILFQCYLVQQYFKQCQAYFDSAFDSFQPNSLYVCILIEVETIFL